MGTDRSLGRSLMWAEVGIEALLFIDASLKGFSASQLIFETGCESGESWNQREVSSATSQCRMALHQGWHLYLGRSWWLFALVAHPARM